MMLLFSVHPGSSSPIGWWRNIYAPEHVLCPEGFTQCHLISLLSYPCPFFKLDLLLSSVLCLILTPVPVCSLALSFFFLSIQQAYHEMSFIYCWTFPCSKHTNHKASPLATHKRVICDFSTKATLHSRSYYGAFVIIFQSLLSQHSRPISPYTHKSCPGEPNSETGPSLPCLHLPIFPHLPEMHPPFPPGLTLIYPVEPLRSLL